MEKIGIYIRGSRAWEHTHVLITNDSDPVYLGMWKEENEDLPDWVSAIRALVKLDGPYVKIPKAYAKEGRNIAREEFWYKVELPEAFFKNYFPDKRYPWLKK